MLCSIDESKITIDRLHFYRSSEGFKNWCIDVSPIFVDMYGDNIISTAVIEIEDGYTRSEADIKQYCEVLLKFWEKRPRYIELPTNYNIHITFVNGQHMNIESDYNGLYLDG